MPIPDLGFTKMHGLGNDFVMVTADAIEPLLTMGISLGELAKGLCNRHCGVGGDGLIVATPPTTPGCVATFVYWNGDGTVAEMCGNGIRCFAQYLQHLGWVSETSFMVDSLAGVKTLTITDGGEVSVDMGRPVLAAQSIPAVIAGDNNQTQPVIDYSISGQVDGSCMEVPMTLVNVGNPHAVTFAASLDRHQLGPVLETHPAFPEKINVEFATVVSPNNINLHVWERGCGWTQACGTGACATVVAAILSGAIPPTDGPVAVDLPGGTLHITWPLPAEQLANAQKGQCDGLPSITMTGPATTSYTGRLSAESLQVLLSETSRPIAV